jgi:hypothetical protein
MLEGRWVVRICFALHGYGNDQDNCTWGAYNLENTGVHCCCSMLDKGTSPSVFLLHGRRIRQFQPYFVP